MLPINLKKNIRCSSVPLSVANTRTHRLIFILSLRQGIVKAFGCSSLRGGGGELGTIKTLTYGSN